MKTMLAGGRAKQNDGFAVGGFVSRSFLTGSDNSALSEK